ncbi:MAG: DNA-directed RNA polymerase [Methanosarcinales archaeon]|nr:MAG: DNA-directed RNA polymerase [Methanosarcinales archaeon]
MYKEMRLIDTIRIPPEKLGSKTEEVVKEVLEEKLEGRVDKTLGSIVAVTNVVNTEGGRILAGDGGVYYTATFDALVYMPGMQEIIEGDIVEVAEFGAFICLGPLDGLLHVSQITDDYISYDEKNARLVGKESGRSLAEGDSLRARIVAVSLNEREPRESKIGLTMRQTGLGKLEWLEEMRQKESNGEAK